MKLEIAIFDHGKVIVVMFFKRQLFSVLSWFGFRLQNIFDQEFDIHIQNTPDFNG